MSITSISNIINGSKGTYKIVRQIGCGGMGCVYEGRDNYGNKVAIKVPALDRGNDIRAVIEKLEVEAKILKEIENMGGHKYIVRYIDDTVVGAYPVLIVEFVEGELLENYVRKRGGLDPNEACDIMMKVLDALEFLHNNNILYRDLAPDNIMIRRNGDPVLIDFGTAKMGFTGRLIKGTIIGPYIGGIGGKPYHPPELASGIALPSSDIYMWCATLIALLRCRGGRACIDELESNKYRVNTQYGPAIRPPQDLIYGNCIPSLDVLKKCLDPDYNKRYPTISELRKALRGSLSVLPRYAIVVNGRVYDLDPSRSYILGVQGDIRINNRYVSRVHARLIFDKASGKWIIEDLCSTNGTIVVRGGDQYIVYFGHRGSGGSRGVCGRFYLEDGDVIALAFHASNYRLHAVDIQFISH